MKWRSNASVLFNSVSYITILEKYNILINDDSVQTISFPTTGRGLQRDTSNYKLSTKHRDGRGRLDDVARDTLEILKVDFGITLEVVKPPPRYRQFLDRGGAKTALPEPMGSAGGKHENPINLQQHIAEISQKR